MVFVLVDTYTREILAFRVHEGRAGINTSWVAGTVKHVFAELKRQPKQLIHDNDKLFKGNVIKMCKDAGIKKHITPVQFPVMNVYVERCIYSIKYEMTHHIKAQDGKDLQSYLDEYKHWYNKYRPHQGIGGLTPEAFAAGEVHPQVISIEELRSKKLKKITFADGLLQAYKLVDVDLKKTA